MFDLFLLLFVVIFKKKKKKQVSVPVISFYVTSKYAKSIWEIVLSFLLLTFLIVLLSV